MSSEQQPLHLKLYITGETLSSRQAIENLRQTLENEFSGRYELDVIDILERPQLAEDEKILATPALIKDLPPPVRRIVGDLADREQVLLGLDLQASGAAPSPDHGGSNND